MACFDSLTQYIGEREKKYEHIKKMDELSEDSKKEADKQLDDIQLSSNLSGAGKRVRFLPALPDDGESLLRVCIVNADNATTMKGRFYFKGMLFENQ